MDTNLALVSLLIVALIFVPIILLIKVGNKNKRKLGKQLKALADKYELKFTEKEFWGNAYIGFDDSKQKLLFLRLENETLEESLVAVTNMKECKINTVYKRVNTNHKKENVLSKVDFQMYFTDNSNAMKSLNFYDHNRMYSENLEVKRAEKWKKLIGA